MIAFQNFFLLVIVTIGIVEAKLSPSFEIENGNIASAENRRTAFQYHRSIDELRPIIRDGKGEIN